MGDEDELTGPAVDTAKIERNLGKLWRAGKSPEAARRYLVEREGIDQPDELLANFWPAGAPETDFTDVRGGSSTSGAPAPLAQGSRVLSMFNSLNPFNDELAGGVAGLGRVASNLVGRRPFTEGVADAYRQTRDDARWMVNDFHQSHPKEALAYDIGIGIAAPSPFGKTRAVSTLGRIGAAAVRGAGEGALYGFGNAEGSAGQQALETGASGLLGGTVGATAQGVSSLFQRGPGSRAADLVAQSAKREDRPVETVLQGVVDPAATGAEAMGQTGRQLATRVARQGGAPADAIVTGTREAAEGTTGRVRDTVARALGVERKDPRTALKALRDAQVAEDAVNYPKALGSVDDPIHVTVTPKMRRLLENPDVRRAMQEVRNGLNNAVDRQEAGAVPLPERYDMAGKLTTDDLTLTELDALKKGLDDLANQAPDPATAKQSRQYRDATDRINSLLSELDTQSPEYATARASHARYQGQQDALLEGTRVFAPTERVRGRQRAPVTVASLTERLGKLDPESAEMYRLGALHAAAKRVKNGRLPDDVVRTLGAIVPDGKAMQEVVETLQREGDRADLAALLERVASGAPEESAGPAVARAGLDVATGATGGGFAGRAVSALSRENRSLPLATRTELAKLLGSRGPALREAADATLRRVERLRTSTDRSGRTGRSVRTIFNQDEDE